MQRIGLEGEGHHDDDQATDRITRLLQTPANRSYRHELFVRLASPALSERSESKGPA